MNSIIFLGCELERCSPPGQFCCVEKGLSWDCLKNHVHWEIPHCMCPGPPNFLKIWDATVEYPETWGRAKTAKMFCSHGIYLFVAQVKKAQQKKFLGLGLKLNSVLLGFPKWCLDQMVCRLNWCLVFATSSSNLILSYQARISILTIPPRNIVGKGINVKSGEASLENSEKE